MDGKDSDDPPPNKNKTGRIQAKFLGPVINLEEHVNPNWWSLIFNSLYLKTDADVVEDLKITSKEVDLIISSLNMFKDDKILDLCCGQGRHCLELTKRGFKNVEGLDRSHYLIQKAKTKSRKEGLNVRFREGDARKLPYMPDSFDVVMILGNSFGYFDSLKDDLGVLEEVARVLRPWGKLIIDVTDGGYLRNNFQKHSWEWIDKKHFVCRERSISADTQRLISREIISNIEKGVIADQFYAERLYTKEKLSEFMNQAGFNSLIFHGNISPDSQRNQDLGMMERRIIVSGVIRKDWDTKKKKTSGKSELKTIAVIMGDPNKPDKLKPMAVFDDDDFYTIDRLKAALQEINGCEFIYLNNHNTLMQDLKKLSGKIDFVFNLCDEGYNNDPRKELHIPALLEKLDINYTGAGPQCLAHCYDKSLVRGIAKEMGILVPNASFINSQDTKFELNFEFPVIAKPNFGDSSFGITKNSVANNHEELLNAISEIRDKFGYEKPIIVEEFLNGKDLSVGIVGNPPNAFVVLPITEEDYSLVPDELPKICGYEAKWDSNSPYWNIKSVPAKISEEIEKSIVEDCLKLFERLECRDYTRFDWRLNDKGEPKLLEVNPNPGWCWDGHLAKMANLAGISYSEMLKSILNVAVQRLKNEKGENSNGNGNSNENSEMIIADSEKSPRS